jgi:TolA-binding protein
MKGVVMKVTAVNLALGIAIGAAILWFLVLPAVIQSRTDANTKQIQEFSQQYAAQQAQISAQKKALDEYRNNSEETQAAVATASSTKDSYENLMTVSDQYNDGSYSNATMAETLLLVNRDSLGTSGQELYDRLAGDIFSAVCDRQYSAGVNDIDVGDYAGAVEALTQVIKMDESYGDGEGLYYLGVAYARNGDTDNANTQFKRVIELFPDSDLADQAQEALDGKIQTQSDSSSSYDSYDDESYEDEE